MNNTEEASDSELPMFNFVCQYVIQHQSTLQYANRMKRNIQSTTPSNNGGGYGQYNSNYKGKDLVEAAAEATDQTQEANAS